MKITTKVGVVLLLVAATSVIVGAGSFTSTEADRGVNVSVVDDESAYIGFEMGPHPSSSSGGNADYEVKLNIENGTHYGSDILGADLGIIDISIFPSAKEGYVYNNVVRITNQFESNLDTDITVSVEDGETKTYEPEIGVGKDKSISAFCKSDSIVNVVGIPLGNEQIGDNYNITINVNGSAGNVTGEFNREVHVKCGNEKSLF